MKSELITLLVALVSGGLALAGVAVSNLALTRRDRRSFLRQSNQSKLDALRALYEEVLFVIERTHRTAGVGTEAHRDEMIRVGARLRLRSTREIHEQFEKTGDVLDRWAAEWRKWDPPAVGGVQLIQSGMQKHKDAADQLFPVLERERELLVEMMREHLRTVETLGE